MRNRRRGGSAVSSTSRAWRDLVPFDEAFRIVRSNVAVAISDLDRPTVIITSAEAGEGKTLACANLAVSFALAGQRVVLVDLDLRHADAHKLVGTHNEFGVTDVLLGRRGLDECLQYVELSDVSGRGQPGLYFLSTGPGVANPTELLGMGRTARMLDGLARQADLVLLDTPPVLPVADTLVIGRMAAGAVLVVESRGTSIDAIQKAKDLLIRNQTRLLGVVLNKLQGRDAYAQGFGYGHFIGNGTTTAGNGLVGAKHVAGASGNGNGVR
jgi:capsular exopolysaccharide synthesis family protein